MKVLFLDIDGVLVTKTDQSSRIIEGVDTDDKYGQLFSPLCIAELSRIIEATGAGIVITSTWRIDGLATMRFMWNDRKLPGYVEGITPLSQDRSHRGSEIKRFINEAPEWFKIEKFIMIDDETWHYDQDQLGRLIRTTWDYGLTKEKADLAIQMLNEN